MVDVTLICPIYNSEDYIAETIRSLNEQNYKSFIVYFIDDGSSDDTVNVIKNTKKDFEYEIFFQNHAGAPAARNLGIKHVNTKYVYLFDSDDLLKPDTLEILVSTIRKENSDIVLGNMDIIGQEGTKSNVRYYDDPLITAMHWIPTPGVHLLKSSLIKENDILFSNIKISQDLNYFLKYLSYCKKISFVDEPIYSYRIVDGSISRKYNSNIKDIVKSSEEAEKFYPDKGKVFTDIKLIHYYSQFSKFLYMKTFDERCEIYVFFINQILSIKCFNCKQFFSKSTTILKCIAKFFLLFLSKWK